MREGRGGHQDLRLRSEALNERLDQKILDTTALGEVVGDLLLPAQLEGNAVAGEPVHVGALAETLVRSLRAHAEESGTALDARRQDGSWVVTGAGEALRRALGALVDNAIEHTPGGRVVVGVGGTSIGCWTARPSPRPGLTCSQARSALRGPGSGQSESQIQQRQTWRNARLCRSRNDTMTRRVMASP